MKELIDYLRDKDMIIDNIESRLNKVYKKNIILQNGICRALEIIKEYEYYIPEDEVCKLINILEGTINEKD